jgi:hypothetical protein
LCLWSEQEGGEDFPGEFVFSPEELFGRVVEKYPDLKGEFPTWFEGNYSTGVFVPAARVAEVLAWVEGKVGVMEKGDQRRFKGVLGILRAAAAEGYAYWEATDLAVPAADEFVGDPSLMMAKYLGNEVGTASDAVQVAEFGGHMSTLGREIVGEWLLSGDYKPFGTGFWDLSQWPPRLAVTLEEFAKRGAMSRDGRWILVSETRADAATRTFRPRLYGGPGTDFLGEFPLVVDGKDADIDGEGFVGDRAVVFLRPPYNAKEGDLLEPPRWLDEGEWKLMPGLEPVAARASHFGVERPVVGVVHLADGRDVVIWDGDGYELVDGRFEMTFLMGARGAESHWTYALAGEDGFFYLSNRCLFEVHRGEEKRAHAEKWTNIMYVRPGPAGSVLLQEGENKHGDVGKLYFPANGTFIHIEPALFDDKEYSRIYWGSGDRFVVVGGKFLAVSGEKVLGLQRHNAKTGRAVKR